MPDEPNAPPDRNDETVESAPRAFAVATGYVFQIVGFVYFLGAGLYWFMSGCVQGESAVRVDMLKDYFEGPNFLLFVTTVNVLAAVVGGLAMLAFGLGLQGETQRSGVGATITAGMLTALNLLSAVLYVVFGPAWGRMAIAVLFAVVNATLFLLAGHSAALLRRFPPPADRNIVDDAWIEEYHRTRRARRDL